MKKTIVFLLSLFSCASFSQQKLDEVKVEKKPKGIQKSFTVTANTSVVTNKELLKAACCNLSESFETNPSIDVNFSDALTGTKQIKMLGLTSPYLMITEENIPSVRGASQAYGLTFTPGTWIESIQITKGAGSVLNGYESISGQINTELVKPKNDIPFFLNIYGSSDSRLEANTHFTKKISDRWSTSLLLHANERSEKLDMNQDGFLDNPLTKQINILNRYQYYNPENGWVGFLSFKYMKDKKQTGDIHFDPNIDRGTTHYWGSEINTERFDLNTKIGYVFKNLPFQSIGFQNAINTHIQNSYFGLREYFIKQNSYYSNLIFNSIIDNTKNKFATGLNFTLDKYAEFVNITDFGRTDTNIGVFFEYTYDNLDHFSVVLGGRMDHHNRLGTFFTPRLHLRYNPWDKAVVRLSAGRGKRIANLFAENQNVFGSSKIFEILNSGGPIYGLNPEIAWNYGISFSQKGLLFNKKIQVDVDFYRTDFQNQVIVDVMSSFQQVLFYNLKGLSYANSFQLELDYEIFKNLNWRTAYKWYDVQTQYISGKYQKPLQSKNRFFTNLEYEFPLRKKGQQWKLDFTLHWIGEQQLPNTSIHSISNQFPNFSPSYSLMNAQVSRKFSKTFEVYFGGENIGNYKQKQAILGAENPFGNQFDASIVYAPIFGSMYYAGLRFKINP